ncbi:MAG: hypothetical protein Q7R88_02640 [bacterium]|nr:hypothetical protein [bacterium]
MQTIQTQVKTSQGLVPLGDAVRMLISNQLPTGDILGVLKQLSEHDTDLAEATARKIMDGIFPPPVKKAAVKILSGRSLTDSKTIRVQSSGQLLAFLSPLPKGQLLRLKFGAHADPIASTYLLGMNDSIISFPNQTEWAIMVVVSQSRRWEGELNKVVTVRLLESFDPNWFATRLANELDTIELC